MKKRNFIDRVIKKIANTRDLDSCVSEKIEGVKVLDESKLEDKFSEFDSGYDNLSKFRDFTKKHKIHYYAKPKESFSKSEGIQEAKRKGFKYIIMENMS